MRLFVLALLVSGALAHGGHGDHDHDPTEKIPGVVDLSEFRPEREREKEREQGALADVVALLSPPPRPCSRLLLAPTRGVAHLPRPLAPHSSPPACLC